MKNVILSVVFGVIMFCLGYGAYSEIELENWNEQLSELSFQTKMAERDMKSAEEECFWQAMDVYNNLMKLGGEEYISVGTKSILEHTEGHLPNLEYYIAAIKDMSVIDPCGDAIDYCDYEMACEAASKAEAKYAKLSAELDSLKTF